MHSGTLAKPISQTFCLPSEVAYVGKGSAHMYNERLLKARGPGEVHYRVTENICTRCIQWAGYTFDVGRQRSTDHCACVV